MFQKIKVPIMEQTYAHYRPFTWFFRCLLIFPVVVQRTREQIYLVVSPFLMVVGYGIAFVTMVMAYRGIYLDVSTGKNDSIRVTSDVDKVMYLNDVTCYSLVYVCGLFINPSRFISFFNYIRSINKVDCLINTTFRRSEKYKMGLVLAAILSLNAFLFWIDLRDSYSIFGNTIGMYGVLERYLGIDIIACTANFVEYTSQVLLSGFEKRIRRLNKLLEAELNQVRFKNSTKKNWGLVPITRVHSNRRDTVAADTINKLCKGYHALMDAADTLNNFLGLFTAIMIVAVLWGLIESSYFLLTSLANKRGDVRDAIEIPGFVASFVFHLFRMLLITEPPYACLVHMETTKRLVCHLLACNVNPLYNKQTKRLAMMLVLRPLEFSACGLFIVDRLLFTALLDTIVTLLVIALQYRDEIDN